MTVGLKAAESDQELKRQGRRLLPALHAALQAMRLYPIENDTVQKALAELHATVVRLLQQEGRVELRFAAGCCFLNQVRLPLELSNYTVFDAVERVLARFEIGGIAIDPGVAAAEWPAFIGLLLSGAEAVRSSSDFEARLARRAAHIHVQSQSSGGGEHPERTQEAKRVYVRSVQVASEVLTSVRLGQAVNVRKVKRAIQGIVDQVLNNEPALVGMTTLRDFDEYTFTHSVNVCILCVVFGHRLGLDRHQLYELGLCGLFHDLGKMRIDRDVLHKPNALTETEWGEMRKHPTRGLLALFRIHGFADTPFRQMLAAYEHHMKVDLSGYPRVRRPRQPTLFTRIVSVVDTFDAVTSVRSYRARPWPPDKVLKNMRDEPGWGLDPVLVKAFIQTTGIYPIGSIVLLSDRSLAVVVETSAAHPLTPTVKAVCDANGMPLEDPPRIDLAKTAANAAAPRILRALDSSRHGLDVTRYFA